MSLRGFGPWFDIAPSSHCRGERGYRYDGRPRSPPISFPNSYRRILTWESKSHVWIALHRLVEAYARSAGIPFSEVFAELEGALNFRREERERWPDLETMRDAARILQGRREALLRRRNAWIAARRRAKARLRSGVSGKIEPPAPELLEHEARCRAHSAAIPEVGCWGWRALRRRRDGASS